MKEKSFSRMVSHKNKALFLLLLLCTLGTPANVLAQISNFPHTVDFEDENECAAICNGVCNLQGTFQNVYTDDLDFATDRAGTPSGNTGPVRDHTTDSRLGKYVYVETSCNNQGYPNKRADFVSAYYDFSAVPQGPLNLSFWYHMLGNHMGILSLDIDTTGANGWITDVITPFTDNQNLWQNKTLDLSSYIGRDSVRFRFRYVSGSDYAGDVALDDIDVYIPQSNDFQVISINDLRTSCSLTDSESVTVTVYNHSPDTLLPGATIDLSYQVDAQTVVTETFTLVDTFFTFRSLNFTFAQTADFSALGTYQVAAWASTIPPGDLHNEIERISFSNIESVNSFPYCQDFEAGSDLWTWGGQSSSWAWGTPQKSVINSAYSGAKCMVNGGLTGQYGNGENNWIMGPCYDLTNTCRPQVSFWAWWETEYEWDGAVIQYSTNDGATWIRLGAFGNPNNWYTTNDIYARPGGQTHGWSGAANDTLGSGGWVQCKRNFYNLAGQASVQLRFAFASDFDNREDGFAFDDFAVSDGVFLGKDRSLCAGDTLILDADSVNGDNYMWSTGATTRFIQVTQPGTYWVEVTNNAYCPTRDTIEIVGIGSNFAVSLGPDLTNCGTVVIDAGYVPGVTYQWSNGAAGQVIAVDSTGNYWVDVTTPCGVTRSDTLLATVLNNPTLDLGPADTIGCGEITLVANPATSYNWSTGDVTQSTTVNQGGTYAVTVTASNGCSATDSIGVTIASFPTADLGLDRELCDGDTLCLTANPDTTLAYAWTTGATTNSICITNSGIYIVTVTNASNCPASDTVFISTPPPPLAAVAYDSSGCPTFSFFGNSIGGPGNGWVWDFGDGGSDTSQNPTHSFPGVGVYNVQLTVSNGCGIDSTTILVPVSCEVGAASDLIGQVRIYPNPSTGSFGVQLTDLHAKQAKVTVRDAFGKTVYLRDLGALTGDRLEEVELSRLSDGLYFLELQIGEKRVSKKLILQR